MTAPRSTSSNPIMVASWIKTDSYSVSKTPNISCSGSKSDPFQKRVVISGSFSGNVSVLYDTSSESKRKENLIANGKVVASSTTTSDKD